MENIVNILRQIKIGGDQYTISKLFCKLLQVIRDNTASYGQLSKSHLKIIWEMLGDLPVHPASKKSTVFDTGKTNFAIDEIISQMTFWLTEFLHKIFNSADEDLSLPSYCTNMIAVYAAIILELHQFRSHTSISSTNKEYIYYNDKPLERDGNQSGTPQSDDNLTPSFIRNNRDKCVSNIIKQDSNDSEITTSRNVSALLRGDSPVAGCSRDDMELPTAKNAAITSSLPTSGLDKRQHRQGSFRESSSDSSDIDSIAILTTSRSGSNQLVAEGTFEKQKRSSRINNRNTLCLNLDKDTTLTMNTTKTNTKISFSVKRILSSPTDETEATLLNASNELLESSTTSIGSDVESARDSSQGTTIKISNDTNLSNYKTVLSSNVGGSNPLARNVAHNVNYTQVSAEGNLASSVPSQIASSAPSDTIATQQFAVNMLPVTYCYQLPNIFPAPVYAPVQVRHTQESFPYFQLASSTSNKTYRCNICLKVFTRSYSLTRHKRIHTRERPYKCSTCGKSFSQSYHLKIHFRIHSRDAENP
ncbi:Zinc finger and SCAN domain-containing protein 22 [Trichoplax sp. H2]|nr:Zinc finger and SCAN domain-containing protein 22 [Trichoplax sp. H2]|eukprot:RDD45313.1 Zinc finger and SCAN domain-containing protein 22 [Trichoplax sp. H2]